MKDNKLFIHGIPLSHSLSLHKSYYLISSSLVDIPIKENEQRIKERINVLLLTHKQLRDRDVGLFNQDVIGQSLGFIVNYHNSSFYPALFRRSIKRITKSKGKTERFIIDYLSVENDLGIIFACLYLLKVQYLIELFLIENTPFFYGHKEDTLNDCLPFVLSDEEIYNEVKNFFRRIGVVEVDELAFDFYLDIESLLASILFKGHTKRNYILLNSLRVVMGLVPISFYNYDTNCYDVYHCNPIEILKMVDKNIGKAIVKKWGDIPEDFDITGYNSIYNIIKDK